MYIYIYIYIVTCIYMCMYMYIYIYTYITYIYALLSEFGQTVASFSVLGRLPEPQVIGGTLYT